MLSIKDSDLLEINNKLPASEAAMKFLIAASCLVLFGICRAQHAEPGDLEPLDDIDEAEFEEYFHLDPVEDPEELKKRNEALKKNEEEIKKTNEAYKKGEKTWYDGLNEFDDLPADEFIKEKTGVISNTTYGRGLLEPSDEEKVHEESERYFDEIRFNRAYVPSSYSSKSYGKSL